MARNTVVEMCPSGNLVDLDDPDPATIEIQDIAHHLARICRYNGAPDWYSVAEHSVLLSEYVEAMPKWGEVTNFYSKWQDCLTMLLHDSSEAYMGDWSKPMTNIPTVYQAWEYLEFKLNGVISQALDIRVEKLEYMDELDKRIVLDERARLLQDTGNNWSMGNLEPLGVRPEGWERHEAEAFFLNRYNYLVDKLKPEDSLNEIL